MQKKEGRRVKMTKMLLKESLIELMKTKPIHEITIKDICSGADVNRSTFYRHYNTPHELYADIISDVTDEITALFQKDSEENSDKLKKLTSILQYVENNRETFLVLLGDKSNVSIGEMYSSIIAKFIDPDNTSELSAYVIQFVAAGMTSIVWTWLSKENRRPAKEVAALTSTLLMHGLKRAIDFSSYNNS